MSAVGGWAGVGSVPGQPAQRRLPAVLVVDDEADLRELLSLTLVRLGLDVDTAESVAAARALLAKNQYALCLTDMRLPDGSGLDLVRDVAASAGPPIAVITAYGSAENAVAALKAGAFDYLTKPVDINQLRMLVRSAVRECRCPRRASCGGGGVRGERARTLDRQRASDAPNAHDDRTARTQHGSGRHPRRIGQRQRACRAGNSRLFSAARAAVRCGQLRRDSRDADGG